MATITKEQAIQLDLILRTLLDKTTNIADNVNNLNSNLFPYKSKEYCLSLFYKLAGYRPKLLYPEDNLDEDCFWASEYVPVFLHDGGFTLIYEKEAQKQELEAEKERLNLEKLKYDVKNAKRIFKTYWWTFVISIIGLSLTLGKIIFDILTKK